MTWKIANFTPGFKKGSRRDPGNYRSVSLEKSVESVVKERVMEAYKGTVC